MKHKKSILFLITLTILICVMIFFSGPIIQKSANYFLNKSESPLKFQVSSVETDLSKAKASFSLTGENEDTGKEFLNVDEVIIDSDFNDWSVEANLLINGVTLKVGRSLLETLQELPQKDSSGSKGQGELPPLGVLSTFEVNDIKLIMEDAKIQGHTEKVFADFDKGSGHISEITATLQDDFLFTDIPKIDLNFGQDFFDQKTPRVSIRVINPNFKVNQELIDTLQGLQPNSNKQAQTEKPQEQKKTDHSILDKFRVDDFNLNVIGKSELDSGFSLMMFDLNEGTGRIENIRSKFSGKAPFFKVKDIYMDFDMEGLLKDKGADLNVAILGTRINMSSQTLESLNNLPKPRPMPEDQKAQESTTDISSQVSRISVHDTALKLEDQNLKTTIKKVIVNMSAGSLSVDDIRALLTKQKQEFLEIEKVSVKFDPQKLTAQEKPDLKVSVNDLHLKVSKTLLDALKSEKKEEKKSSTPAELPFSISRFLIGSSSISMLDYPGVGKQKYLTINGIFGNVYNITMMPGTPLANFVFNATLDGESKMIAKGKLDLADNPIQWSVDWKVFDLDLTKLNKTLRAKVPVTYREGIFNVYGEAIKRDEKVVGYIKPFLKDASYLGNKKEFKGIKHFFVEMAATVTNWIFENKKKDSVATKIPFVFEDGKLNTDISKAAWKAIEHGLLETDTIKPGLDQKYQLRQAQEE